MLSTVPSMLPIMESVVEPSARIRAGTTLVSMITGAPMAMTRRYSAVKPRVSSFAPSRLQMGLMSGSTTAAKTTPITMAPHTAKALIFLILSYSPLPSEREMAVQPPLPSSTPRPDKMENMGEASVTAATLLASPVWPIKNTSAM